MTEQQAQSEAEEPAPPSDAGQDGHADSPQAPLGEWRGPVFWMACGAVLAGMVGGAVALFERVAVERDMMAVAATLPAPPPATLMPVPAPSASQSLAAGQAAAGQAVGEIAPALAPSKRLSLQPSSSLSARHVPARRQAARHTSFPRVAAAKNYAKPEVLSPRQRAALEQKYAQVFRRCPAPGMAGAVQCRRDICNGAEGRGPACKPYVRKPR